MLHLLIHVQSGYLLHPSIEIPTVEMDGELPLIANVGTDTGYTEPLGGSHSRVVLNLLADISVLASGLENSPTSYHMLVWMASLCQMSSTRLRSLAVSAGTLEADMV